MLRVLGRGRAPLGSRARDLGIGAQVGEFVSTCIAVVGDVFVLPFALFLYMVAEFVVVEGLLRDDKEFHQFINGGSFSVLTGARAAQDEGAYSWF